MKVDKDKVVTIDYTLKNAEGAVVDSSPEGQPLSFIQGSGMVISGIEDAVSGKSTGDSFSTTIEPADAYGEYSNEMIFSLPKAQLNGLEEVQVGMQVQAETEQGPQVFTVKEIGEESITFDANHPMAGHTLYFDIEIKEVRDATPEELDHGHAH